MESGEVSDLGVSAGPPGKVVPPTPFPTLKPSDQKRKRHLDHHKAKSMHHQSGHSTFSKSAR